MPKRDLFFRSPIMNAAGMLGFAPDLRAEALWSELGAFVTNPLSWRSRKPTSLPMVLEYSGGFLLHTGLPNPGLSTALKRYTHKWADSSPPIIVNIMADHPEATARMVELLERVENIMAAELGFAPLLADDIILTSLEMAMGELPLIVSLPAEQAIILGPRIIETGAVAVSLSAPRGSLSIQPDPSSAGSEELIAGRLYGPGLFPQSLETVHRLAGMGVPVIGGGGVYTQEQVEIMKQAGAMAVQLDAILWRGGFQTDPGKGFNSAMLRSRLPNC
jgi:dihydroorotate dehydrogenase (NAD+) catalytic subunit